MAAEGIGEYAPHRCPVRCRDDAYCGTAAGTEDTPEFRESSRGIREELQAELAHHGVKSRIPEREGRVISSGQLARVYGFTDADGTQPDCWRYVVEVQDVDGPADDTDYR